MTGWTERILVAAGALVGLAGVALAAMAAHRTGPGNVETASRFLLWHAPVLLAVPLLIASGLAARAFGLAAGLLVLVGVALFAGDLALRELAGIPLFRMAAPAGGTILMAGWAALALAALLGRKR